MGQKGWFDRSRRAGRRYFELLDGRGWVFDWFESEGERVDLIERRGELFDSLESMAFKRFDMDFASFSVDFRA